MRLGRSLTTFGAIGALTTFLGACGGDGVDRASLATPTWSPDIMHAVTLEEAQSLLPFEVVLPSFLPDGVLSVPELSVFVDEDGTAYQLIAMYREDESGAAGSRGLRMRFVELSGSYSLGDHPDVVVFDVRGVPVEFSAKLFGGDYAEAFAAWDCDGVGFGAEFGWLRDGGPVQGPITDEMRGDALRVIDSMIK